MVFSLNVGKYRPEKLWIKTLHAVEYFSENSNLHDSSVPLPAFPSRTNLKQHNIPVTPKMFMKVITNLDSSDTSGPDYIQVLWKYFEPELSCILDDPFKFCLPYC